MTCGRHGDDCCNIMGIEFIIHPIRAWMVQSAVMNMPTHLAALAITTDMPPYCNDNRLRKISQCGVQDIHGSSKMHSSG